VRPKYRHCRLGQANPSGFTHLGAPRRLFTSGQGRDIRRLSSPRGSGAETTGGAVQSGSWLEETVDWAASGCPCSVGRLKREPAKTPKQS
jgi:hypothetical protein